MNQTKNDKAWEKLFTKYDILAAIEREGFFKINSSEINEFREARLMTKFDHKKNLPSLFLEHNFSILPVSRGSYIIAPFETFADFEDKDLTITPIDFPAHLESINYHNITSESTALNCAYVSGILADFLEDALISPTVNGRMSSGTFDFTINAVDGLQDISVDRAQVEIDGGYEGANYLSLIEAKNAISNDFLVRQLYYPFRLWAGKINKKVKPIFLTYTNGIFHLREYVFEDPSFYNSIRLVKEKKYTIREGIITLEVIQNNLNKVSLLPEPQIPFPQADSFDRVINLCELLNERKMLTKEDITNTYDFDKRQTDYYTNAGRYLGFIKKETIDKQTCYSLTAKGKSLFKLSIFDRQIAFVQAILSHKAFKESLKLYIERDSTPTQAEIVDIMEESDLYKVNSESTFKRRSSTISGWINWILRLIE